MDLVNVLFELFSKYELHCAFSICGCMILMTALVFIGFVVPSMNSSLISWEEEYPGDFQNEDS
jgi:hypothetical protein